jgi:hypothetical protein
MIATPISRSAIRFSQSFGANVICGQIQARDRIGLGRVKREVYNQIAARGEGRRKNAGDRNRRRNSTQNPN